LRSLNQVAGEDQLIARLAEARTAPRVQISTGAKAAQMPDKQA
jgi:hypothetical protein